MVKSLLAKGADAHAKDNVSLCVRLSIFRVRWCRAMDTAISAADTRDKRQGACVEDFDILRAYFIHTSHCAIGWIDSHRVARERFVEQRIRQQGGDKTGTALVQWGGGRRRRLLCNRMTHGHHRTHGTNTTCLRRSNRCTRSDGAEGIDTKRVL